jgi:hypothetical protein
MLAELPVLGERQTLPYPLRWRVQRRLRSPRQPTVSLPETTAVNRSSRTYSVLGANEALDHSYVLPS